MTTSVQTPAEPSNAQHFAEEMSDKETQSVTPTRRLRRVTLVFVFGFLLGAVVTTATRIVRSSRMPLVLGNRNIFVSLPFSGISLSAPSIGTKRQGSRALARLKGLSRRKAGAR